MRKSRGYLGNKYSVRGRKGIFSFLLTLSEWYWFTKLYTGFRCTVPQHNICTLYYMSITSRQFSIHYYLCPMPSSTPHLSNHHTDICIHKFVLFIFHFNSIPQHFHPVPNTHTPTSDAVSLLSISLSLFCLLVHFVN